MFYRYWTHGSNVPPAATGNIYSPTPVEAIDHVVVQPPPSNAIANQPNSSQAVSPENANRETHRSSYRSRSMR